MRAILQRVRYAKVTVGTTVTGAIEQGLLILLGIHEADTQQDMEWLAKKIFGMRIFSDAEGKMNLSVADINGGLLVVSQFTLFASTKKGNRPSFLSGAKPDKAQEMYDAFIEYLAKISDKNIQRGMFGADMKVELENDGPVTIFLDSQNLE
ncbi:MAG: D-tyrosyl-tRNA(Tyr) deacylase [Chitinophagales bacterium]|nr:D-tyrosyl-tRNA(Tyr) deacylase [Chitinophagales bacterium]